MNRLITTRLPDNSFEERTGLPIWYALFILVWFTGGVALLVTIERFDLLRDSMALTVTAMTVTLMIGFLSTFALVIAWGVVTGRSAQALGRVANLGVTPSRQQIEAMFPRTGFGRLLATIGFHAGGSDQQDLAPPYTIPYYGWELLKVFLIVFGPMFLISFLRIYFAWRETH